MRLSYFTFIIVLLVAIISFGQPFQTGNNINRKPAKAYQEGEIVVKFIDGITDEQIKKINKDNDGAVLSHLRTPKAMRVRVAKGLTVEKMVEKYSRMKEVAYAEPNYIAVAHASVSDPLYSYQWHFDNAQSENTGVKASEAWDIVPGGTQSTVVAVLDGGVAYEDHIDTVIVRKRITLRTYKKAPDLAGTVFIKPWDFVNNDAHPNDDLTDGGHGTHVTGTIAQTTDNGVGCAGIAYGVSIMPVKVLDASGSGAYSTISNGIRYAADNGANVINMSLGGSYNSSLLQDACAYAYSKGVTIVASAGNDGDNPIINYPAAYNDYVIAVAGTRYDGTRAYYSTMGSYVDIAAPGGDVTVDQNSDGYGDGVLQQTHGGDPTVFGYFFYQGTSMAAPHVSAIAALLVSRGINDPSKIREALQNTARDKGDAGVDAAYGYGLVDAPAALAYRFPIVHDVSVTSVTAPAFVISGNSCTIFSVVANQGGIDETFTVLLKLDGTQIDQKTVTIVSMQSGTADFTWNSTGATTGMHTFTVQAVIKTDANPDDNSKDASAEVMDPAHDLAIAAVDAPEQAVQGTDVTVTVEVANQGTFDEQSTVTLIDNYDNSQIGSSTVSINAMGTTTISFPWNTTSEAIATHELSASVATVSGETDLADNNALTVVNIVLQPLMHIEAVAVVVKTKKITGKLRVWAEATVSIKDDAGLPVPGALVAGHWVSELTGKTGTTGTTGAVTISSDQLTNPAHGTVFTFVVDNVTKTGTVYDSGSNVTSSGQATYY